MCIESKIIKALFHTLAKIFGIDRYKQPFFINPFEVILDFI